MVSGKPLLPPGRRLTFSVRASSPCRIKSSLYSDVSEYHGNRKCGPQVVTAAFRLKVIAFTEPPRDDMIEQSSVGQ
ncbi:MAG: hypothetical protein A2V98_02495 [Planctomycetes bacterium RBG_16_64_12]|nr:MAG: hypothetical protein A2V98_02495 [Planctomycetes bacterium RBG_16_64_12]